MCDSLIFDYLTIFFIMINNIVSSAMANICFFHFSVRRAGLTEKLTVIDT